MRCFYCAEEIQDAAVVCRYCGRDLQFVKPFVERIVDLERRQTQLEAIVEELSMHRDTASPNDPPPPAGSNKRKIAIAALAGALGSWLTYVILKQFGYTPAILLISICVPLPFGIAAGLWTRGRGHAHLYAIFGALAGLLAYFAVQLTWRATDGSAIAWTFDDLDYLVRYILAACFLFLTGGLLGDQIEGTLHPSRRRSGTAEALARRMVGRDEASGDRVKKLADLMTSLAPLLTLIGSIVAAYQTLQAAMPQK